MKSRMPAATTMGQRVGAVEHHVLEKRNKPTIEDRSISLLTRARGAAFSIFTFGWISVPVMGMSLPLPIPQMLAFGLGKVGVKSAKTLNDMAFKAPIEALHAVNANKFHTVPAEAFKNAAAHARASESAWARGLEAPMTRAAEWVSKQTSSIAASARQVFAPAKQALAPVGAAVNARVASFSGGVVNQTIEQGFKSISGTRLGAVPTGGKGLTGLLGNVGSSLGKTKSFYVILGAGVAAGLGAMLIGNRKESRTASQALAAMAKDLGNHHPLYQQAASIAQSHKYHRGMGVVASAASEAVMFTGASIKTAIAVQMLPSAVLGMFFKDNAILDAYTGLQKVEKGELQASASDKAQLFQVLLGNLPVVQSKGGSRNLLAAAAGQELAAKGTTVAQFGALLNDQAKFNRFLTQVSDKMEAAKAAQATAAAAPVAAVAAPTAAPAQPTMLAAAPAAKINEISHQGGLVTNQVQR